MRKSSIVSLVFFPLLGIASFCLVFFLKGNYQLVGWIDPLFFSGAIVLGCGLLSLLWHFGAFDFLVYGFRSIFKHMAPNYSNALDEYPDYYAYASGKKEKRKGKFPFIWPWLGVSSALLIAAFIIRGMLF